MCKEDIRLARKAYPKQQVTKTGQTAAVKLLNANPNRWALLGAMIGTTVGDANKVPMIAAKIGGLYFPLIVPHGAAGGGTVSLVDVGQAITDEIWFVPADALNTYTVYASETELQERLDLV